MTLDYFENKKLYFLKWQDGLLKEFIDPRTLIIIEKSFII